ncbi:MAG: DUF4388 domain-containing protein [Nitrospiria bacterium]
MALKGSIKEFGLTEIFQLIFHQKKEGTLSLKSQGRRVFVQFKDGQIVQAVFGNQENIPPQKLIKANFITTDQIDIARYRLDNQKKAFSELFVELDFFSRDEHKRLSRFFTEEVIFQIFHWKSGEYEFHQKEIVHNPNLVDLLNTQFILMEAIRQIDEWPLLSRKIPSREIVFEKKNVLSPVSFKNKESIFNERDSFGDALMGDLDDDLDWLFNQINGSHTVQDIIDQARLNTFSVYQGIAEFLSEKRISKKKQIESKTTSRKQAQVIQMEEFWTKLSRVVLVAVVIYFAFFSFPAVQKTIRKAIEPYKEITDITKRNGYDKIYFALDLYYLEHNHYPDSLAKVVEENAFIKKLVGDSGKWSYSIKNGGGFHLARH